MTTKTQTKGLLERMFGRQASSSCCSGSIHDMLSEPAKQPEKQAEKADQTPAASACSGASCAT